MRYLFKGDHVLNQQTDIYIHRVTKYREDIMSKKGYPYRKNQTKMSLVQLDSNWLLYMNVTNQSGSLCIGYVYLFNEIKFRISNKKVFTQIIKILKRIFLAMRFFKSK